MTLEAYFCTVFMRSMNWKLILGLALSGPILALAGNYGLIGFSTEPYFALGLVILFAIIFSLAKTGKYFLHGFTTTLLFGVLMTLTRLKFLQQYINANPDAMDKGENVLHQFHFTRSPMIIMACLILISAIIAGVFASAAHLIFRRN